MGDMQLGRRFIEIQQFRYLNEVFNLPGIHMYPAPLPNVDMERMIIV